MSTLRATRIRRATIIVAVIHAILAFLMISHEKANQANCRSNLHSLGLPFSQYAEEHNGALPRTLDELHDLISGSTKIFICPSANDQTRRSYELTGVTNKWNDGTRLAVLREIGLNHRGYRHVLYSDASVELIASH